MRDVNAACLSGRLTRDPEVRATRGGTSVCGFGLAFNSSAKNADGEWEDVPNFIDCAVIGRRADSLARVLSKGKKVFVQGRLAYRSWESEGKRRSKVELVVDELSFESAKAERPQPVEFELGDEEIPF